MPEPELFESKPSRFIEQAIERYVATSPENRLQALDGQTIFDPPLVGFADGGDPIFDEYKKIIGPFHQTPREALQRHLEKKTGGAGEANGPGPVSVISWVMPIHHQTLVGMRGETRVPSLKWNHTRWNGQALIDKLAQHLVSLLEERGYQALAPDKAEWFQMIDLENGLASNWSQRHVAYAAGLGTFSLSDGFITRRGIALRCGSVVTDLALRPSPRTAPGSHANCLHYRDKPCMRCAKRCPADAISEKGHDKKKCLEYLFIGQRAALAELGREQGYIGDYLGCGLCQTRVPCEQSIPRSADGLDPG